jgi:hypothetical protein
VEVEPRHVQPLAHFDRLSRRDEKLFGAAVVSEAAPYMAGHGGESRPRFFKHAEIVVRSVPNTALKTHLRFAPKAPFHGLVQPEHLSAGTEGEGRGRHVQVPMQAALADKDLALMR